MPDPVTPTVTDNCVVKSVTVDGLRCYKVKKDGTQDEKKCKKVAIVGDEIVIEKAPPKGTVIKWTVTAKDACDNETVETCSITVVKPPKGDDDDE